MDGRFATIHTHGQNPGVGYHTTRHPSWHLYRRFAGPIVPHDETKTLDCMYQ
jgi:hypothetical protein